ncbi:hypothetical protein F3Y22_tig00117034pilonHSYRG00203 [Hibiscus syriacus]|uniref:VQ domain-containing protein n=1 Tax=Hibiscus syriacus TaxID=106335 RepID=A0A6A2XEA4_HIBSY|nr:hypothetical protein F3Y22_tig00117034pilonHSYRG00203 [Hibiscus syriacus]
MGKKILSLHYRHSSFKNLVQELTGNATTVSSPSSSSSSSLPQISEKSVPVIEIEDYPRNPESSMESSFDASVESFRACDDLALPFDDTNSSEYVFMNNQRENSSVYEDLQAFLQLDHVDEQCFGSFNHVYSEIQQEVSIYEYELFGLI